MKKESSVMILLIIIVVTIILALFFTFSSPYIREKISKNIYTGRMVTASYGDDSCFDDVENQDETDVDCGGMICPPCDLGEDCSIDRDCESDNCTSGTCVETITESCSDSIKNQDETDVDCGGSCSSCSLGESCLVNSDCSSNNCELSVCVVSNLDSCSDSQKNNDETDVDCGGSCPDCGLGDDCLVNGDCLSGICKNNVCSSDSLEEEETPEEVVEDTTEETGITEEDIESSETRRSVESKSEDSENSNSTLMNIFSGGTIILIVIIIILLLIILFSIIYIIRRSRKSSEDAIEEDLNKKLVEIEKIGKLKDNKGTNNPKK